MSYLLIILVIFSSLAYSQEIELECPENSVCNEKSLLIYEDWQRILKQGKIKKLQSFSKKHGIPIKLWSKKELYTHPAIHWSSTCKSHKEKIEDKKSGSILLSVIFLKNLNKIKDNHYLEHLIYFKNKSIISYFIPRNEYPLFLSKTGPYFTIEQNGYYYGLTVKRNGLLKLGKTQSSTYYPKNMNCPKNLKDLYTQKYHSTELPTAAICKRIWDEASKRYRIVLITNACI